MAALEPSIPVSIARNASRHTWPAYRDAVRHLVVEPPWRRLLTDLDGHGMRIDLIWGARDGTGDRRYAETVADGLVYATVVVVDGADHHLPLTHPEVCVATLGDPINFDQRTPIRRSDPGRPLT